MMKLSFLRRAMEEHFVDAGRVGCPLRKRDVDVEACAACAWSLAVELDAKPPVVRCRPPRLPELLRSPG